jgi:hypothetical protein
MELKKLINKTISEYLNEVRYIKTKDIEKETPLSDTETLRVFHGFNNFDDVKTVMKFGLSGKERAKRIYSFEVGNNPYGLFVTVDFNVIKRAEFANSGVAIEFTTKVSDLESPIWVGGRSYFVQGEYTLSFKNMDEREQQRLINRQKAGESPYDYISKSDRPELADVIFDNTEKQALYIGDLNPNMIKYVWYNEVLHKEQRINGEWVRMTRKEFINKVNINTKNDKFFKYLPNDDFNLEEFVEKYYKGNYNHPTLQLFLKYYTNDENELKMNGFFPKQIKQIIKMNNDGIFDKYIS